MIELEQEPVRSELRRFAALIVIVTATGFALGHALRQPTQMGANDISRWCTVWSLLEKGSYVIDECPWQVNTQDKVYHAPEQIGIGSKPVKHYYSSKPALLPTLIAGILYPARMLTGVPLDRVVLEPRSEHGLKYPTPARLTGSRGYSKHPKIRSDGQSTFFISNRSSYFRTSSLMGCSSSFSAASWTATPPTTGAGCSAWLPRRSAPTCCRSPRP